MERVYLSQEGYDKLSDELSYLKSTKRKEIAEALRHARSLGDLSENAEYDAAKNALAMNEGKVRELEDRLARAEIIKSPKGKADVISLRVKVKLKDLDSDDEFEYTLVGQDEADAMNNLISVSSPVGKALLGKKPGDEVTIEVPAGKLFYKVISLST